MSGGPGNGTELTVRFPDPATAVVDVVGELTADSGDRMTEAYTSTVKPGVRSIVLNFSDLAYMNSGGLGVLVTLLVRVNRAGRQVVAYGLSEHYRQILAVTRLDEAIRLVPDEAAALATGGAG
jgi:anti-sigma B factor antagonist